MRGLIIFLFTSLIIISCNKETAWDCVKTTGEEVVSIRTLQPFSVINIKDNFQISVIQDTVNFVELTGGKNVLPKALTEVKEGVLYLENLNTCATVRSFKRDIRLKIHVRDLKTIHNEGVGNITSEGWLKFPNLTVEVVNGIGDINLSLDVSSFSVYIHSGAIDLKILGKSDEVYIYNAGLGYLFCEGLITSKMHLNHNSTGDAKVFSNSYFNLENDGIGGVYYYGNPSEVNVSNPSKQNVFKSE